MGGMGVGCKIRKGGDISMHTADSLCRTAETQHYKAIIRPKKGTQHPIFHTKPLINLVLVVIIAFVIILLFSDL